MTNDRKIAVALVNAATQKELYPFACAPNGPRPAKPAEELRARHDSLSGGGVVAS